MTQDEEVKDTAPEVADDVVEYNGLVRDAELIDIRLVDFKFNVKPQYFSALRDEAEGKKRLVRGFEGFMSDLFHEAEVGTLGGQFDWVTEVKVAKKRLLKIEARYLVVYGNVPEVSDEAKERYIQRVGKFATYPYFRSLVSQISWEAKAELPIMPVLK
ncbi:hypothetical protein E2F50_13215 [Rhizobium deserti]|uniref:Uncharacterized protein n=1 Tax=Rhizobium deserti TaxID=2547961 RepID=A0A4R5UH89_9HYPH|nr:hypothetical protein [Rhizobium deserti]TDK35212.1 hypothetical protein E2F50_13215 [Rhizobium deserti]